MNMHTVTAVLLFLIQVIYARRDPPVSSDPFRNAGLHGEMHVDSCVKGDYIDFEKPVQTTGKLIRWHVSIDLRHHRRGAPLALRVYRPIENDVYEYAPGSQFFRLVGENRFHINREGMRQLEVPEAEQITVRAGDVLGWTHLEGRGMVRFMDGGDAHIAENDARWSDSVHRFETEPHWNVNDVVEVIHGERLRMYQGPGWELRTCRSPRRYLVSADIDPQGETCGYSKACLIV